jgi:hypothetical protein
MLKNKFTKKIVTSLAIVGVLFGVAYTNVQASYVNDTYFQFYNSFGNYGNHYITRTREKEDSTPAYVDFTYYQDPGTAITMWVTDANHNSLQGNQRYKLSQLITNT